MGPEDSFMRLGRVAGPLWAGISVDLHLTAPFSSAASVHALAIGLSAGCKTSRPACRRSRSTPAGRLTARL